MLVFLTALTTAGVVVFGQPTAHPAAASAIDKKSPMTSTAIEWNSIEAKPNANGSSRKFFEAPTATLEVLECHATTLNPGATNHAILRRLDEEVIIVKEGTIEAFIHDEWKRIGPGSVIFNASNVLQAIRNTGDVPATYHVISFRTAATPKKSSGQ